VVHITASGKRSRKQILSPWYLYDELILLLLALVAVLKINEEIHTPSTAMEIKCKNKLISTNIL